MLNESPRIVGPEGPTTAKIALIGEAPGRQEVIAGRPFVGPAGSLLDRLLGNAGIIRSDCYVTNVIKEQPPKTGKKTNDISVFIDLSKKVPIETDAYKAYRESLRRELEKTKANILVAFGNVPLYTLTGIHPAKITKRRGSVYQSSLVVDRKVIACIHPAACLHSGKTGGMYMWQHFILHDLRKAKVESATREMAVDPWTYSIKPSYSECIGTLEKFLHEAKIVAFDIEVVNLEVSCISFATNSHAISIPFTYQGQPYFTPDQEADIWNLIAKILANPKIKKIGQNLVFDTQFLFRSYGMITNNIDDTMIGQAILVPDFPKGLDFIASVHTNIPYYKDEGKKYIKIGGRDEDFWIYNARDSVVCVEALPRILKQVRSLGNEEAYNRQKRLVPILVYMSERGVRMDVEGLKAESETTGSRISELTEKLQRICGFEINPNSPKQLVEYFYETKNYAPYRKRSTGAVTTDEDALKRLARKGAPEASILLEIRRLSKLKGTYLDVQLDSDGRLRCSYNPVGAADSGRLSSSKTIWGTGMNMQNDPDEFKKYMLFDEGYVGYNMDLSQAENRIVAHIAPEPTMLEAFEAGDDVHSMTASLISGIPIDEIIQQDEEEIPAPMGQGVYTWRFWGKKANHGLNYGLGFKTFALKYEIPERDARFILTRYHQAYPGVKQYHAWIQEKLRVNRTIENLMGKKRLFMERWGDALFKEAYSYPPQSTVADIINERGLIHVYYSQELYKSVELLNQVHDNIVLQIPLAEGWEAHARMLLSIRDSLETPIVWRGREFTIPADLSLGKNMKDMESVGWSRDAKQLARTLEIVWRQT